MPNPGDQHRDTKATANPFEEAVPKINEYTAQEIASLQSRLDRQLGPEYLSTRAGAGGTRVHYITGDKLINLANEVFGFNGWSSSVETIHIDFLDETPGGKFSLGLSATIRVTLKDGTFHEDIGYGQIDNCKGKAPAFEKCKKEAVTDGLKRALRNFGNILGNCLYDKDYLSRVSKIKVAPTRWDADNLHHHTNYAPVKKEVTTVAPPQQQVDVKPAVPDNLLVADDEFGGNLFDEMEMELAHTDDVALDTSDIMDTDRASESKHAAQPTRPLTRSVTTPQHPTRRSLPNNSVDNAAVQARSTETQGLAMPPPAVRAQMPRQTSNSNNGPIPLSVAKSDTAEGSYACTVIRPVTAQPGQKSNEQPAVTDTGIPDLQGAPVGFVTMGALAKGAVVPFDPQAETGPSIRRTVAANKSAPITRSAVAEAAATGGSVVPGAPVNGSPNDAANPTTVVNPAMDMSRKIGMPNTGRQSPMSNGSKFKAPSIKRPVPPTTEAGRQPLTDMSNMQTNGTSTTEAKKQKLDSPRHQAHQEAQA